jgi:hypothetical protein
MRAKGNWIDVPKYWSESPFASHRFATRLSWKCCLDQLCQLGTSIVHTFKISVSVKFLAALSAKTFHQLFVHPPYLCANHAPVTADNFSLNCPKCCGSSVITTTAFCTVDRVTSAGRSISKLASICREHDIPNNDEAVSCLFSVK